jgi:hypothetical protein
MFSIWVDMIPCSPGRTSAAPPPARRPTLTLLLPKRPELLQLGLGGGEVGLVGPRPRDEL